MSLPDDALTILERTFKAKEYAYRTLTMSASKRQLRVIEAKGSPSANYTTYISYDALLVDGWKDMLEGRRILPLVPVFKPQDEGDGAFHAAWLLDWALSKEVAPRALEIILTLGHNKTLPHLRFDYPFPWEPTKPLHIELGDLVVLPLVAYSVSALEAKLQADEGPEALERHFEKNRINVFRRDRGDSLLP